MGIVISIISTVIAAGGTATAVGLIRNDCAREDAVNAKLDYWENIAATKRS